MFIQFEFGSIKLCDNKNAAALLNMKVKQTNGLLSVNDNDRDRLRVRSNINNKCSLT